MPSSACQTSALDRKSTRLNSSHTLSSYAVFCLKKNNKGGFGAVRIKETTVLGHEGPLRCVRCRCAVGSGPRSRGRCLSRCLRFVFFNDTATTEIYTLSLHDALPICQGAMVKRFIKQVVRPITGRLMFRVEDRKSTRLNSSHTLISYAVFCLKKN